MNKTEGAALGAMLKSQGARQAEKKRQVAQHNGPGALMGEVDFLHQAVHGGGRFDMAGQGVGCFIAAGRSVAPGDVEGRGGLRGPR